VSRDGGRGNALASRVAEVTWDSRAPWSSCQIRAARAFGANCAPTAATRAT